MKTILHITTIIFFVTIIASCHSSKEAAKMVANPIVNTTISKEDSTDQKPFQIKLVGKPVPAQTITPKTPNIKNTQQPQ